MIYRIAHNYWKPNKDSTANTLNICVNSSMQRLRAWDARSGSNVPWHRNLMQALNELGRLKDKLGITNAIVKKSPTYTEKPKLWI